MEETTFNYDQMLFNHIVEIEYKDIEYKTTYITKLDFLIRIVKTNNNQYAFCIESEKNITSVINK